MNACNGYTNSNNYYQIILDSISGGMQISQILYDEQGKPSDCMFLDVNSVFAEILGHSRDEIVGKKVTDFYPEVKPELFIKYDEIVKSGKPETFEMWSEPPGCWYKFLVVPLGDQNKFAIIGTDITEFKEMQNKLIISEKKALKLVSELKEADKNKNKFINILSHELKNPLATISSGIELWELTNKNKSTNKIIKIIKRQVEQLSRLVDDLLDITRISQNKIVLNKDIANLKTILNDAILDIKPQFEEKGIKLLQNTCRQHTVVYVDSLRITQCIVNILKNSLKFTHENGIVSISLDTDEEGRAVINIQDNGIGINPEMLARIFEPYSQDSKPSDNSHNKGLGLGLSIVKEFIEMHNGDVSAYSPGIGKGSSFTMRLPIHN